MDFLREWALSPGFGGAAAVVAAVIALLAARVTSTRAALSAAGDRDQRERAHAREQWWARARWALDLTLSADDASVQVGFTVLEELARSELADAEDGELIAAATAALVFDVEARWPSEGPGLDDGPPDEDDVR